MKALGLFISLLLLSNATTLPVVAQDDILTQSCVKYRLLVEQFSDGQKKILGLQPGDCPDWSTLPAYEQPEWIIPGSVYITLQEPIENTYLAKTIAGIVPGATTHRVFADILPEAFIYRATFDPKAMTNRAFLSATKQMLGAIVDTTYTHSVPRFVFQSTLPPNDPLLTQQWHLKAIGALDAFARCPDPLLPIKVGVVDNGFAINHPDLKEQIVTQYDVANDDTDASVPDPAGDGREHGTVAAGIIGAISNNKLGVSSVGNNNISLVVIKGTEDGQPGGAVSAGLEGMAKAVELGVDVLNVSRGTPIDTPMVEKVTKALLKKDIILVAAAGNQNTEKPFYPAAYEGVIGVSAIDANNKRAVFSNYGSWVTISAPGVNIITTDLNDWYGDYQGTSEAAPIVAGAIGFAMAHGYGWEDIKRLAIPLETPGMGVGKLALSDLCQQKIPPKLIPQTEPNIVRETHGVATESAPNTPHSIDIAQKRRDTIYLILLSLLAGLSAVVIGSGIRHWWITHKESPPSPLA